MLLLFFDFHMHYSLRWKGKNMTVSWWSGCAGWNGFRIWFHLSKWKRKTKLFAIPVLFKAWFCYCTAMSEPLLFCLYSLLSRFFAHYQPWPTFFNCSLLPLRQTLFVTLCIHESANYQFKPLFTHWMQPLKQETTPIKNGMSCWSGWPCWNGFRIWFLPASGRGRKGRQRIQFYIGWFSSSPFSLPSTQSAHITRGVKLGKCVTNQGIYPIFMMHNISPSFTSSSIIYGFIYLYYCTHSFTIPLFASCLSFVWFSLRKVYLPLQVTAFPTLFNKLHFILSLVKRKNKWNDHDSPGFLLVLRYSTFYSFLFFVCFSF